MTLEERYHANYMTKHGLPLPRWEWLGDEEALIRICDQHSKHHVKIGAPASRTDEE
jgi:hypothetical protein